MMAIYSYSFIYDMIYAGYHFIVQLDIVNHTLLTVVTGTPFQKQFAIFEDTLNIW